MNRQNTEDFQGILYDTKMVDTCYHTFVKIYRIYSTKIEP